VPSTTVAPQKQENNQRVGEGINRRKNGAEEKHREEEEGPPPGTSLQSPPQ